MGEHHRNPTALLATNGYLPPPHPGMNLQQLAALRGLACPTCRRDGTQTTLFQMPIRGGKSVLFCVACLIPHLALLVPPMVPLDLLPPLEPPVEPTAPPEEA
jgi:hypothetical protein